ncbi:hypothetical protein CEE84_11570 [Lactobacillus crispatus]|nr:hypothetical protein CEE84_11570 [Lactobacillus crispatus]
MTRQQLEINLVFSPFAREQCSAGAGWDALQSYGVEKGREVLSVPGAPPPDAICPTAARADELCSAEQLAKTWRRNIDCMFAAVRRLNARKNSGARKFSSTG